MTNVEEWMGLRAVEATREARDRNRWRQVVSETVRRRPMYFVYRTTAIVLTAYVSGYKALLSDYTRVSE
jgi:hypothetical protein